MVGNAGRLLKNCVMYTSCVIYDYVKRKGKQLPPLSKVMYFKLKILYTNNNQVTVMCHLVRKLIEISDVTCITKLH